MHIDCNSEEVRHISTPEADFAVLVVDSGVRRALVESGSVYRDRVWECNAAFEQARDAGLVGDDATSLRDLQRVELGRIERALDPVCFRRARHVISENERVETVCTWLEAATRREPGALEAIGERLDDGQRSLRDDFEVSIPELDFLCEHANRLPGVYGSRLTGAGMGGCTLHLAAPAAIPSLSAALAHEFELEYGRRPECWSVQPASGAESIVEI
jgi:galactokinase